MHPKALHISATHKTDELFLQRVNTAASSEQKPYCVVGIDPGVTAGVCIISTEGNVIVLESKKDWSMKTIISFVETAGSPLVVSTDKVKIPDAVEKVALAFGAKIVAPPHDLSVEEKNRWTKGHEKRNSHERDALAAALFGYNAMNSFFKKVKNFALDKKVLHLEGKLMHKLLKNALTLEQALDELVSKPKTVQSTVKELPQPTLQNAFQKIRRLEQEIVGKNRTIAMLEAKAQEPRIRVAEKRVSEPRVLRFRDERVRALDRKVRDLRRFNEQLQKRLEQVTDDMLREEMIWMPTLEHITTKKVSKLSQNNRHWAAVFVEHNTPYQEDAVRELAKVTHIVLCFTKPIVRFPQINWIVVSPAMIVRRFRVIGLTENTFSELKQKEHFLSDVVERYQVEREAELRQIDSGKSV